MHGQPIFLHKKHLSQPGRSDAWVTTLFIKQTSHLTRPIRCMGNHSLFIKQTSHLTRPFRCMGSHSLFIKQTSHLTRPIRCMGNHSLFIKQTSHLTRPFRCMGNHSLHKTNISLNQTIHIDRDKNKTMQQHAKYQYKKWIPVKNKDKEKKKLYFGVYQIRMYFSNQF